MTIKELIFYLENVSVKSGDDAEVILCTGATTHESIEEVVITELQGNTVVLLHI